MNEIIGQIETTIDSLELAKLSGRRHDVIKKSIERMNRDLAITNKPQATECEYKDNNRDCTKYVLNLYECKLLALALDGVSRIKLLDKIEELEQKKKPQLPSSYRDALYELIEKDKLLEQAEKTKAQIGDKKVATAMNTASQKSKETKKLQIELDKSKEYCTVKRMQMLNHGQKFNWRLLKSTTNEMRIDTEDVFDVNYGTVKSYHKDVWLEAYGLTF